MKNPAKHILAEKENIEKTLSYLKEAVRTKENKSAAEIAGTAVFVHNFYNGIENILKQILKSKNIILGNSENWHKELLESSFSKGIISRELADKLYEYLTFRHFFIHSYGFKLDDDRLLQLANDIPQVWSDFLSSIETYL
ncbi:MAG: hypothetical protein JW873_05240 [Candidatus Saganbacteria bacterium]|nr:hypothetical protein [Candidatus Saganbacteria bacterium]